MITKLIDCVAQGLPTPPPSIGQYGSWALCVLLIPAFLALWKRQTEQEKRELARQTAHESREQERHRECIEENKKLRELLGAKSEDYSKNLSTLVHEVLKISHESKTALIQVRERIDRLEKFRHDTEVNDEEKDPRRERRS